MGTVRIEEVTLWLARLSAEIDEMMLQ